MKFHPTKLQDVILIELRTIGDARGYFARTFCRDTFAAEGLETEFPQHNTSFSADKGTIRGLHFQRPPHGEVKLMRAVKGAIFDVVVDLRPTSATYGQWAGFELSADTAQVLYVPSGFAHGFQTLQPDTMVAYPTSHPYTPDAEGGVRFDDPDLGIDWPVPVTEVSDKDRSWPDLDLTAGGPL